MYYIDTNKITMMKKIPTEIKDVKKRKYFVGKKKLKHVKEWEVFDAEELRPTKKNNLNED